MASTYLVAINDQPVIETDCEIGAWTTYRAAIRRGDLRGLHAVARIHADGLVVQTAVCGDPAAPDTGPHATPNDALKALIAGRWSEADIKAAAMASGYAVSNSRVQGWLAAPSNRKYQAMTLDELYLVIRGLP